MKKTVVVTGGNGTIGRIVTEKLSAYFNCIVLDLPTNDILDRSALIKATQGADAILHLAWDNTENWKSGVASPDNLAMAHNVIAAAVENRVPKLLMASTVHVDPRWLAPDFKGRIRINNKVRPTSPYGKSKKRIETMTRNAAARSGLHAYSIRFGCVAPDGGVRSNARDPVVWLGHEDCAALIRSLIEADVKKGVHETLYAVSDVPARVHDLTNSAGWRPVQTRIPAARPALA